VCRYPLRQYIMKAFRFHTAWKTKYPNVYSYLLRVTPQYVVLAVFHTVIRVPVKYRAIIFFFALFIIYLRYKSRVRTPIYLTSPHIPTYRINITHITYYSYTQYNLDRGILTYTVA